jgi:hypothetical protein
MTILLKCVNSKITLLTKLVYFYLFNKRFTSSSNAFCPMGLYGIMVF